MKKAFLLVVIALITVNLSAQRKNKATENPYTAHVDSVFFKNLKYRLVGPFRGGRADAVAGSYDDKNTFYFGATGGGVWKTTDGGSNWKNVSDGFFGGSIGAVAVAPSASRIVYAGEGEGTLRSNVSEGIHGMWRSENGGRTWKNIGLANTRHITKIVVDPYDPNTVWVAAMGHLFGANNDRGIYKTTDGGKTWKHVLFVNNHAGCVDIVVDEGQPSILYAGTWNVKRTPYSMESGGAGSGLWKSTDGGETWTNISKNKGLPGGVWGIVGVAVAPTNPKKIYAVIENKHGGLFVSEDSGKTWKLVNKSNEVRMRAWYFSKIYVDPNDENHVYYCSMNFYESHDGGKNFKEVHTPHPDHHCLWIDPKDGDRMIIADDGGAQVSFNGGKDWSTYYNQPTGQFYRITTDNAFPYRLLSAQQDNTTVRIRHRTYGRGITRNDWEPTAGFESGYVTADPLNPEIVYGSNYFGMIDRENHKYDQSNDISVWPIFPYGEPANKVKYRFQWNLPIFFSPNNPKKLYAAANVLFETVDGGQSWKQISPDLTTNDSLREASSGGLITPDNSTSEYYCTIFTAAESPLEPGLIWTGSDDGVISITQDGGANWKNVTPPDCPKWMMWNCVEVDPFQKGTAWFVGTRYKLDDYKPYIYKTEDYGKTWTMLTNGIPSNYFVRCLRADPKRKGLLYAGTEYGMFISFDAGKHWQKFQLNLPQVPITDLTIKDNDLAIATQGRALWELDDLSILQQMKPTLLGDSLHLFDITSTWSMDGPSHQMETPQNAGANPPTGAVINYYLKNPSDSSKYSLEILDKNKQKVIAFSNKAKKNALNIEKGMNQFVWDMKYPKIDSLKKAVLFFGYPSQILAPPGKYYAKLKSQTDSMEVAFELKGNPNFDVPQPDYDARFELSRKIQLKFNDLVETVNNINSLDEQISGFVKRQGKDCPKDVKTMADSIKTKMKKIENEIMQTKAKDGEDLLQYPGKLLNKLSGLYYSSTSHEGAPSQQDLDAYKILEPKCNKPLDEFKALQQNELKAFNALIREKSLPVIWFNPLLIGQTTINIYNEHSI